MEKLFIDKTKTALVVIDLQKGILSMPTKPYHAHEVIENAVKLVVRKTDEILKAI